MCSIRINYIAMSDHAIPAADVQAAAAARKLSSQGDVHYMAAKYQAAFDCFSDCVRLRPNQPAYHHRLALAAWKLGRSDDVDRHFSEAIGLNPHHFEPHKALAQWLLIHGRIERALHHSKLAHDLAPHDLDVIVTRAAVLDADGQTSEAWKLLEPAISTGSMKWHLLVAHARLAPKIGREVHAAAMIEQALEAGGLSNPEAAALHFAAASLLDSIGRYDDAFSHARSANELGNRAFDPIAHSKSIDDKIRFFTAARSRPLPRATPNSARPVFIVGMPRSGTTLIEQILACHPAIFGGGELTALNDIASSLSFRGSTGAPILECFDSLSAETVNRLAADYLRAIDALDETAKYVTDKMPHNFDHLWLVEALFPNCHVIHCVRDPRDTCLSCYLTDFSEGNAFSSDLGHLASFHRDYRRLMEHWKKVLSVPILEVRYEDLVADAKGQTARMLEFLDLPWDENCLDFHNSKRTVVTASREQVRKPLYASSVGRWRHYEKHIPELLALADQPR